LKTKLVIGKHNIKQVVLKQIALNLQKNQINSTCAVNLVAALVKTNFHYQHYRYENNACFSLITYGMSASWIEVFCSCIFQKTY